jgi:hypothetical protein
MYPNRGPDLVEVFIGCRSGGLSPGAAAAGWHLRDVRKAVRKHVAADLRRDVTDILRGNGLSSI